LCTNNLHINYTFFNPKPRHKYTWENMREYRSTIDYILTNKNIYPSKILDVRSIMTAETASDHRMVLGKLRLKLKCKQRMEKEYEFKINIESLQDDSTKDLYRRRIQPTLEQNCIIETDAVEASWSKVKENFIIVAAKEALAQRRITVKGESKIHRTLWFCEEIKLLTKEK